MALLVLVGGLVSGAAQAALHDRGGGLVYDDVLNVTWLADANYAGTTRAASYRYTEQVYDDYGNYLGTFDYMVTDGRMRWSQAIVWADRLEYYDNVRNVTYDDWRLPIVRDSHGNQANIEFAYSGSDVGYNVRTVGGNDSGCGTIYGCSTQPYLSGSEWVNGSAIETSYLVRTASDTDGTIFFSELAYMYYVNLGFKGLYDESGNRQNDAGIFENSRWGGERDGIGPNGAIINLRSYAYWAGAMYSRDPVDVHPYGDWRGGQAWGFGTDTGYQGHFYPNYGFEGHGFYAWAVRDGDVAAVPEPSPAILFGAGFAGLALMRRRSHCVCKG